MYGDKWDHANIARFLAALRSYIVDILRGKSPTETELPHNTFMESKRELVYLGDKLPARLDAPALGADVVLKVAVVRHRRQRRRTERSHDEEAVRGLSTLIS